jgi:DNA repair exonuclease SbcCD ATPase subunit
MQHRRRNEAYEEEQGTVDLPQAFADDGPTRKVKVEGRQRKQKPKTMDPSSRGNTGWIVTFSLLMIVVLVASYFLVAEHEKTQIEHAREDIIHEQVEPLSKVWEEKYAKLEEENEQMKSHEMEYERMKSKTDKLLENESEQQKQIEKQEAQIQYYKKYQQEIKQRIKLMSRAVLVEK